MANLSTNQLLAQGWSLHQAGRLNEARAVYTRLLEREPGHSQALQLLGMLFGQSGDFQRAADLLSASLDANPRNAEALNYRGNALQELGQLEAAIASYDMAISIRPAYAEALYNRGNALQRLAKFEAAVASYDRALEIEPNFGDIHFNRGNALKELRRFDAAVASYDRAIALQPGDVEAHTNRGSALIELKQPEAAIASFDRAIAMQPNHAVAHYNRATVLHQLGQLEASARSYGQAIAIHPDYAEAHANLGLLLQDMKQLDAALASCDRAIAIKPDYAEAHSNRGNILQELQQYEAAIASYDRALAIRPDFAEAHFNRGIALKELQRLEQAVASYDRAIALRPDYAEAIWNKSLALLLMGDLEQGLKLHEWRWKQPNYINNQRRFAVPLWLGEPPLQGKTILLHAEQGLGDTLQFCRYARLVSGLGARVILEVPGALMNVLNGLEGVDELRENGSVAAGFDYHCPLLSLPLALKTSLSSIPRADRYLRSDAGKVAGWHARLGPKAGLRIGVAWSSTSTFRDDAKRSLRLSEFLKALPDVGIDVICLQKEIKAEDTATLQSRPDIRFYGDKLDDLSDTAALTETVDLVVSTCTSVPHLSCALGKPTWILLSHVPDWRWMLHRDDSPWYPSARLYRQAKPGAWDGVLGKVRVDLQRLATVSR